MKKEEKGANDSFVWEEEGSRTMMKSAMPFDRVFVGQILRGGCSDL